MNTAAWRRDPVLVSLFDTAGVAGEQFRKLQVKMRALKNATGGKLTTIVVTSPLMGEGKTSCATNLALAMAHEPQRRVLLIDCDVRKPRIHGYIDARPTSGVIEILEGKATLEDSAVRMPGGNLDVVVLCGSNRTNGSRPTSLPMERLKDHFQTLGKRYEFVICDAPPLLPTADAGALVDICDGAIMVIRAGVTPRPAAAKALASIDRNKLIGFLLNGVTENRMGKYYYQYYAGTGQESGGRKEK